MLIHRIIAAQPWYNGFIRDGSGALARSFGIGAPTAMPNRAGCNILSTR
jgi:hypothetical protein